MAAGVVALTAALPTALSGCEVPTSCEAAIGLRWINDTTSVRVQMQRVAWRESRNVPTAMNASGATGCLQLMPVHRARAARLGYTWADMLKAWPNVMVAYDLWREQGWRPWAATA